MSYHTNLDFVSTHDKILLSTNLDSVLYHYDVNNVNKFLINLKCPNSHRIWKLTDEKMMHETFEDVIARINGTIENVTKNKRCCNIIIYASIHNSIVLSTYLDPMLYRNDVDVVHKILIKLKCPNSHRFWKLTDEKMMHEMFEDVDMRINDAIKNITANEQCCNIITKKIQYEGIVSDRIVSDHATENEDIECTKNKLNKTIDTLNNVKTEIANIKAQLDNAIKQIDAHTMHNNVITIEQTKKIKHQGSLDVARVKNHCAKIIKKIRDDHVETMAELKGNHDRNIECLIANHNKTIAKSHQDIMQHINTSISDNANCRIMFTFYFLAMIGIIVCIMVN